MEQPSFFQDIQLAPPDAIFGLAGEVKADTDPNKCNLVIGAYRTEEGEPYVLPVVRSIESSMAADKTLNHEYLPIEGNVDLASGAKKLILGKDSPALEQNRVCAIQSLSGTGALRLAFEFVMRNLPQRTVYISKPTWGNHKKIIQHSGFTDIREYRYFNPQTNGLDLAGMLEDLQAAPENSVVLLHGCAHNPCGVDPNKEEWPQIYEVVKNKKIFVIFDVAYQGFVSGSPEEDAWAVRDFVAKNMEMLICQSFAKIFGIYNERAGAVTAVCRTSSEAMNTLSQLKTIVRPMYSNPPNHGARIVATILNNPALESEWREQLKAMADRILKTRSLFHQKLKANNTPGDWSHIMSQTGMFTFTGLKPKHVEMLKQKYHIYMLGSGRINMCGINPKNIDYIANAFHDVVSNTDTK